MERARRLLSQSPCDKSEKAVVGGDQRQQSVANGLEEVGAGTDLVMIHDGARPFLTQKIISDSLRAVQRWGASVIALPVSDTIKLTDGEGLVQDTLDRSRLWAVQTPQTFSYQLIRDAYRKAEEDGFQGTDDASLVERLGHSVKLVPGSSENIKITTQTDLHLAEQMARGKEMMAEGGPELIRTGMGYDVHRLVEGRRLILGGVEFPGPKGLQGYSDADVLTHVVCDALLGAIGSGDIGQHFPETDARYAGIDSLILLKEVGRLVEQAGYRVANVDVVVIAEEPKIAPRVAEIKRSLAEALGVGEESFGVKGTTAEGLGAIGAGEAIASYAVALVTRRTPDGALNLAPGGENAGTD